MGSTNMEAMKQHVNAHLEGKFIKIVKTKHIKPLTRPYEHYCNEQDEDMDITLRNWSVASVLPPDNVRKGYEKVKNSKKEEEVIYCRNCNRWYQALKLLEESDGREKKEK